MIEGSTDANKRLGSTEITLKAGTYAIKAYFKAVDANASIRLGYAVTKLTEALPEEIVTNMEHTLMTLPKIHG